MAYELIYTSAERGIKPGSRGFCTVACTKGMRPQMIQLLESLSGYKNPMGGTGGDGPVAWSHLICNVGALKINVVSRICGTSPDHTGRSNKLAHHLVCSAGEQPAGGPAWMSLQPGCFLEAWSDSPHYIECQHALPTGNVEGTPAEYWAEVTGDGGYASLLPRMYLENSANTVYVVCNQGVNLLKLFEESLALLPVERRWRVTYNTCFSSLTAGATCLWRGCLAGSELHRELLRSHRGNILDLNGELPALANSALVEQARQGIEGGTTAESKSGAKNDFVLMSNRNINQLTLKPRLH